MACKPRHRPSIDFCRTLWHLIVLVQTFLALLLVLLSVLEAVLQSKGSHRSCFLLLVQIWPQICLTETNRLITSPAVGQVAGQYYLIVVDQQHSLFVKTTLISAALYTCNTIVKATSLWLSELLAYRLKPITLILPQGQDVPCCS